MKGERKGAPMPETMEDLMQQRDKNEADMDRALANLAAKIEQED